MKENKVNLSKEINVNAKGDHTNGNCVSVLCITTGKVYTSLIDAASAEDCSYSALSACLRGKIKTCHGKQFCYAQKQIEKSEEVLKRLKEFAALEEDAKEYRKIKEEENKKIKEIETIKRKIKKSSDEICRLACKMDELNEKLSETDSKLSDEKDKLYFLRESLRNTCEKYGYAEF